VHSAAPMADTDEERKLPQASFSETGQATKIGTPAVIPLREDRYGPGVVVEQKYELIRLLGEGGMGSVWVARNLTLDVHVALKLVHSALLQQVPGAGERMLQEARAAACISHPAIVQVFDFGKTRDGEPYISMELLHGESLAAALRRRGRLSAVRAIQVLLPIADALSVAHQRGIVHRDLKPDNVHLAQLADGRTQPKILDFGIAKQATHAKSMKLTLDGTVMGSPSYMSPEQARGEGDIDQRADVWAFSVMLYELITGNTPFQGESYNALLWSILGSHPKPIAEHGIDEPELWNILDRGLTKDRDFRFGDMRALGRALAGWLLARRVKEDITKAPLRAWLDTIERAPERPSIFASMSPEASSDPPHSIDIPSLPELPLVVSPRTLAQPPPPPEPARPASPPPAPPPAPVAEVQARRTRTGDAKAEARAAASSEAQAKPARPARSVRNSIGTRQKRRAEARAVLEAALLFEAAPRPKGKEVPDSTRSALRSREKRVHWAWFVLPAVVALSFFIAALAQEPDPVEYVSPPAPPATTESTPSEHTPAPVAVESAAVKAENSGLDPESAPKPAKTPRTRAKPSRPKPTSSELKNPFD
jgi:serine/threonine protein kinase